jgi:hypothetical protein
MKIQMELTTTDRDFCVDLMGKDDRNTEIDLPEGVRLRYVKSKPTRRSPGMEVLILVLNVPLNVAASVAAALLLDHIQRADRRSGYPDPSEPRIRDLKLEDGSRIDPLAPDAEQDLTRGMSRSSRT